jgi:hypothetical protein
MYYRKPTTETSSDQQFPLVEGAALDSSNEMRLEPNEFTNNGNDDNNQIVMQS